MASAPLSPGDRWHPTASEINGFRKAADSVQAANAGGGADPKLAPKPGAWNPAIVKNNSGVDVYRGAVLGIDGPIFLPNDNLVAFRSRVGLKGVEPAVEEHVGKFCVAMAPIKAGSCGEAAVAGVVPTYVYVNAWDDKFCDVIPVESDAEGPCYLGSGGTGARILWWEAESESANGTIVWAIVQFGVTSEALIPFELSEDLAPGETKNAYPLNADWTADTAADTFEVVDRLKKFRGLKRDGTTPGSQGLCQAIGTEKVIVQLHEQAKMIGGAAQVDGGKNLTGVTDLYSLDGGLLPIETTLTSETTPPLATTGWKTNAGADGIFVWDDRGEGSYRPVDLECVTPEDE